MANDEHLDILRQGVNVWNSWRKENPEIEPVLAGANLFRADLKGIDLSGAVLNGANLEAANLGKAHLQEANLQNALLMRSALHGADLRDAVCKRANLDGAILKGAVLHNTSFVRAKLTGARLIFAQMNGTKFTGANLSNAVFISAKGDSTDFRGAKLIDANLHKAILRNADFREANLSGSNLRNTDLTDAKFMAANLRNVSFVETVIAGAGFQGCRVYGVSAWDLIGEPSNENDLVINPSGKPSIQVDGIEVAQFIYLLIENQKLRKIIDTFTSRVVLILGRFTPERKIILDDLKKALRKWGFVPIVFDFDRPKGKDFTETVMTMAGLSLFVIADITNPKSSPLELQATIPNYQVPFVPIIQEGEEPFSMMANLQSKYDWVLDTLRYDSSDTLIEVLKNAVIDPAIEKHNHLQLLKAQTPKIRDAKDFLKNIKIKKSRQ